MRLTLLASSPGHREGCVKIFRIAALLLPIGAIAQNHTAGIIEVPNHWLERNSFANSNGVMNPATCGNTPAPSWCNGSDIFAWANAAIAACSGNCDIYIPATQYGPVTTTLRINKPGVSVHCATRISTQIQYTGTGDAILVQPLLGAGSAGFNPVVGAGGIYNCSLVGSPAGASGIHLLNANDFEVYGVTVKGFTGRSGYGAAAFWLETGNIDGFGPAWTERNTFARVYSYENTNGFLFTNSNGSGSFGRTHCIACFLNVGNHQSGVTLRGAGLYDSFLDISGNLDAGTVQGTAIWVDDATRAFNNTLIGHFESNQDGLSTCVRVAGGGQFFYRGDFDCINSPRYPMVNDIDPNAHFYPEDGRDPLQASLHAGVGPTLFPQTVHSLEGLGLNSRWDGTRWQCNGDGGSDGCAVISGRIGTGAINFYSVPSIGGNNRSVSQDILDHSLVFSLSPNGPLIPPVNFGALPACTAALEGLSRTVKDSRTANYNAKIQSGGPYHITAYCNGSDWVAR